MSDRRDAQAPTPDEAAAALRRMRIVLKSYHETMLEIATQTRGKGATLARETIERWSGGGGR